MKTAIILTDHKPGHENQSKALSDGVGLSSVCIESIYRSKFHKFLSYILDRLGIYTLKLYNGKLQSGLKNLTESYACVIGAGSNTFYALKCVAKLRKIPCVAILTPKSYRHANFDLILAPEFDNPPTAKNIIKIPTNLTPNRDDFYLTKTAEFLELYKPRKERSVAVIVGGSNSIADVTAAWFRDELTKIFAITPDCEHWVTTSRRTSPEIDAVIEEFPFDYKLIFSKNRYNPIPAFVTKCERLFVTAESTGMISEAVTCGNASVEVLMNIKNKKSKFAKFIYLLSQKNKVNVFDGTLGPRNSKINLNEIYSEVECRLRLSSPSS